MDSPPDFELSDQALGSMTPSSSSFSPSHFEEEGINLDFESRRGSFRRASVCELRVNCTGVALIISLFGSMFLMVGLYGPRTLCLGPNASILVEPSSMFVESIMVTELDYSKPGLQFFGFSKSPPLDVFANWSEPRVLSFSRNSYKGWPYYLNKGTTLNISYNVKPQGSEVQLVVHEGIQGISQWLLKDAAYRYTAWSWNIIKGCGNIELDISKSSSYYVSVANLKSKDIIKVELDIDVRAVFYDTKPALYKCTFTNGECTFNAMSLVGNAVVVTSPSLSQGVSTEDEWSIRFIYQPRWCGYVIGIVIVICFTVVAMQLWKRLPCCVGEGHIPESDSATRGLLQNKDEDSSSMGSCNESLEDDDADLEVYMGNEGKASKSTKGLCAICCDAPRDCFFLPCGHCVSCYQCGTKMEEAAGSCPICGREVKVKRIYKA